MREIKREIIFFFACRNFYVERAYLPQYQKLFVDFFTQESRLADTIFCRVLQDVHINEVISLLPAI